MKIANLSDMQQEIVWDTISSGLVLTWYSLPCHLHVSIHWLETYAAQYEMFAQRIQEER
jgi:hypothetical protein